MKYYIKKGDEEIEVSDEKYYREKEKLFRIKMMAMDSLGVNPFTTFSDLSRTKQTRYLCMVKDMLETLTYEQVIEQSNDLCEDVFRANPKDMPLRLL